MLLSEVLLDFLDHSSMKNLSVLYQFDEDHHLPPQAIIQAAWMSTRIWEEKAPLEYLELRLESSVLLFALLQLTEAPQEKEEETANCGFSQAEDSSSLLGYLMNLET